jgi:hypothetical protein
MWNLKTLILYKLKVEWWLPEARKSRREEGAVRVKKD